MAALSNHDDPCETLEDALTRVQAMQSALEARIRDESIREALDIAETERVAATRQVGRQALALSRPARQAPPGGATPTSREVVYRTGYAGRISVRSLTPRWTGHQTRYVDGGKAVETGARTVSARLEWRFVHRRFRERSEVGGAG